jgi:hypothetical protein
MGIDTPRFKQPVAIRLCPDVAFGLGQAKLFNYQT